MWKAGIVFLCLLILSIYDIREYRVSVWMLVAGTVFVGANVVYELVMGNASWIQSVLGSTPGLFLLLIAWLSKKAGYADGIVLLWLGVLYGYREGLLMLAISLFCISLVSVALLMLRKVKRHTRIPYIPFLTAGFAVAYWSCR